MKTLLYIKQHFNSSADKLAAIVTLLMVLMIVTPFCGWLFTCGCSWPWLGLDVDCNYHQQHVAHKCPWCASILTGWLTIGLCAAAGVFAPIHLPYSLTDNIKGKVLIRIVLGLLVFLGFALLAGWLAAIMQAYPLKAY